MKRLSFKARWSPKTPGRWLRGTLVSLVLSTGLVGSTYALGPAAMTLPGQVALQDEKLTAQLVAAPLRQVMEEVSRLSGARVRWLDRQAEEKPVSVGFTALPLPEALRRILKETNFLLFYTSEGTSTTLTQIWISSKETDEEPPGLTPQPTTQVKVLLQPAPDSASQSEDAVKEQDELNSISVDTLIETAISTLEPSVRVEAVARLGGYAPADPKVEGILSHLASNDSNPQVQAAASEVLAGIE